MSARTVPIDEEKSSKGSFPRSWRGFDPFPRSALESLSPRTGRLNGLIQMWIVLEILNRTWGDRGRMEYAPINITEFHKLCSDGAELRHTERCIADLERRSIIASIPAAEARKMGMPVKRARTKWYRCCVDQWETAPKWEPRKFAQIPVESEEEEAAEEAKPAAKRVAAGSPLVFKPGKKVCRTFAFSEPQQKVTFRSESAAPIQVDPIQGDGHIEFLIKDATEENKAVTDVNTGLQTGIASPSVRLGESPTYPGLQAGIASPFLRLEEKRKKGESTAAEVPRKGAQSSEVNPPRRKASSPDIEPVILEQLRDVIDSRLLRRIGAIDDVMLYRSAAALGLEGANGDVPGLLVELAAEVGRAERRIEKHALIETHLAPKARQNYQRRKKMAGSAEAAEHVPTMDELLANYEREKQESGLTDEQILADFKLRRGIAR